MAVQAERHLHAALRHAQRLRKRQIARQVIAPGFQLAAGRFQREKRCLFTGVFAVDGVNMCFTILRGRRFRRGCIRLTAGGYLLLGCVCICVCTAVGRHFFGLHGFRGIGGRFFLRIRGGSEDAAGRDQKRHNERQADPSLLHGCSSFCVWNIILCIPKV